MKALTIRLATFEDVPALMELYQRAAPKANEEPLFLDYKKLAATVAAADFIWFVAMEGSVLRGCVSIWWDHKHALCKIHRIYMDPRLEDAPAELRQLLSQILSKIELERPDIDVLYCTTRTLTRELQSITLEVGFRVLGIFPKALGADASGLNGLSVYYFHEVLHKRRFSEYQLHPKLRPLYELAAKNCALPPLVERAQIPSLNFSVESLPLLEIIRAPHFVAKKYHALKNSRALSDTFYPFVEPDALAIDPDQRVEVFLRLVPEIRFATIVAERLETPVHPVSLYRKIIELLNQAGFTYVEVLNDSADILGTDCIIQAGFVPCAYFPAFKAHGERRRDYVIYAHSLEKLKIRPGEVGAAYLPFVKAYEKIDRDTLYED